MTRFPASLRRTALLAVVAVGAIGASFVPAAAHYYDTHYDTRCDRDGDDCYRVHHRHYYGSYGDYGSYGGYGYNGNGYYNNGYYNNGYRYRYRNRDHHSRYNSGDYGRYRRHGDDD